LSGGFTSTSLGPAVTVAVSVMSANSPDGTSATRVNVAELPTGRNSVPTLMSPVPLAGPVAPPEYDAAHRSLVTVPPVSDSVKLAFVASPRVIAEDDVAAETTTVNETDVPGT